jgi:hypothetical protein
MSQRAIGSHETALHEPGQRCLTDMEILRRFYELERPDGQVALSERSRFPRSLFLRASFLI